MSSSCLVYAPRITARLQYTFGFLLGHCFTSPIRYTEQARDLEDATAVRINYSDDHSLPADLHIPAAGLLQETGIQPGKPAFYSRNGRLGLYPSSLAQADWPFDLAAATFFLLSRYEEYQPFTPDAHQRFPAAESVGARYGFLHRPVINEWILDLRTYFSRKGIPLTAEAPAYALLPTYDIDLAWAYHGRPWWRHLGALTRDSFRWDWTGLSERMAVLSGRRSDPYDTYAWLEKLHKDLNLPAIYFWLIGRLGTFDRNVSPTVHRYRQLVQRVCEQYTCGLHPSYRSNQQPGLLQEEISRFENLLGEAPRVSRQHFLKLQLPATYRALIHCGIQADYSMGFPEQWGFRAGYGGAFPWYDLPAEQATDLTIIPFAVMDGTLFRYMRLSAKEALQELRSLTDLCRKNQAQLVSLWHNSSFHEREGWAGMTAVYETFLREAKTPLLPRNHRMPG